MNPFQFTTVGAWTEKTHKFNVVHAWWPGGLIVGGAIAYTLTRAWGLDSPGVSLDTMALGWRVKLSVALITPIAAALLVLRQPFPATERVRAGDTQGAAAAFRYVAVLPAILTLVFAALFIYYQRRGGYLPVTLARAGNLAEGA